MTSLAMLRADERAKAGEAFAARGLPHRRIEEWKYSDLRNTIGANDVSAAGSVAWSLPHTPQGLEVLDLSQDEIPGWARAHWGKLRGQGVMEDAAIAFSTGGLALRVPKGTAVREPFHMNLIAGGHGRVLIVLEEGASLTLVETHDASQALVNIEYEIALGANATLQHIRRMPNAADAVRVGTVSATLAKSACYRGHFADFGSKLSRLETNLTLDGAGAEAKLSGVAVLAGKTHADVTTHIKHAAGDTASTQLFKLVAGGQARGVYQGRITVAEGANKSDSRQTAKGLLLGERAEIDLKPELEIFADDVKCAHGAAIGDLDAESLFYLRSRGIPEREARDLLIHAFLADAIAEIEDEGLRAEIWRAVEAALVYAEAAP
ncbi:MAG: Fe-S cluster assembly protein SufD [Proteobacteria bacterium]|nr:Fe-S cluster assembly protein SufD [Pseudomonadota bacterium]